MTTAASTLRTGLAAACLLLAGHSSGHAPPWSPTSRAAAPGAPTAAAPTSASAPLYLATHALVKVRSDDPPVGAATAELAAARNEFESFQIVLRAPGGLRDVDVEVGDLRRADGTTIGAGHVTLYRQLHLRLREPSSVDGDAGEWPDPLVPRTDRYAGERRNAFPFDVDPGRTEAVWVEVYVPPQAPPGEYRADAVVRVGGAEAARLPVRLEVWPFELPSTSSLPNTFGISGISILKAHLGRYTDDDDLLELTRRYSEAALLHRLSTHGGSMIPPPVRKPGGQTSIDWERYDEEVGPFLDGTVFGDGDPLPGARATSVDARSPARLSPADQVAYWRAWVEHFEERGWLDRLFLYLWDEPQGPDDYREIRHLGWLARAADPRLRTLVTEQLVPWLGPVVDVWTTLINCVAPKPGFAEFCEQDVPRQRYDLLPGPRGQPWWYQSCASHGCDTVGDEYFSGWPTYVIDAPAVGNRIMQWLAFSHRIHGELYYSMVRAYEESGDPWADVHVHGGNGDGTLFYPGRPDLIGGRTHVPVESIRLKLIRDGFEDYEYLALADSLGAGDLARRVAERLAPSPHGWHADPERLHAARRELARTIVQRGPSRQSR